jgi:hypothetical protein
LERRFDPSNTVAKIHGNGDPRDLEKPFEHEHMHFLKSEERMGLVIVFVQK